MTTGMFDDVGSSYLEQLLAAALRGEIAQREPGAGRIVASLMWALVTHGAADRVERYLGSVPGRLSTYEVACFDQDYRPAARAEFLDADGAIRLVVGLAAARPNGTAAVIAHDETGQHRCVLLAKGSGLTFQFPQTAWSEAVLPPPSESDPFEPSPGGDIGPWQHSAVLMTSNSTETDDIEELTQYVNEQLSDELYGAGSEDVIHAMGSVFPSAAEIAEIVVNRLSEKSNIAEIQGGMRPSDREIQRDPLRRGLSTRLGSGGQRVGLRR